MCVCVRVYFPGESCRLGEEGRVSVRGGKGRAREECGKGKEGKGFTSPPRVVHSLSELCAKFMEIYFFSFCLSI